MPNRKNSKGRAREELEIMSPVSTRSNRNSQETAGCGIIASVDLTEEMTEKHRGYKNHTNTAVGRGGGTYFPHR